MINPRQAAKTAPASDDRREAIRSLYLESLQLVERLHRRLLDVIKDEFDRNGRSDINAIQAAVELMAGAKRPVLYTGGGVVNSGPEASRLLRELVELTDFPITSTLMGLGAYPASGKNWLGMLGMHGSYEANMAMHDCDVMVCLGARFDDRVTGNLKTYAPNARKIHIDIDTSEIHKNVRADVPIVGDLKVVLQQLLPKVQRREHKAWLAQVRDWMEDADERDIVHQDAGSRLLAAHVIHDMWQATQGNAIVVTDVGQHQMWEAQYYPHERPHTLITSGGLGTMGFGLPAAIGAAMGLRSTNVWAIVGDGGFQMTMAELATAVQERVPVKIAIINNGYLGMVRQWQEFFYEERYNATPMFTPDFIALAAAYGIPAQRVSRREDVIPAIDWADSINDGPVLVEFAVEKHDIVYPMVPAGADLHNMIRRPAPSPDSV